MPHHHLTVRAPAVDPEDGSDSAPSLTEVLRYVEDCHRRCLGALGTAVIIAYDAGAMLHAYRNDSQHGAWEDAVRQIVLEQGLGITLRTCQRYMQVASILVELLLAELGQDAMRDHKTTRATLLRILRQRDLLSINKVLALKKTSARKSKSPRTKPAATPADVDSADREDEAFLTPPAILAAVTEFFGQTGLEQSGSSATCGEVPVVRALGSTGNDLVAQQRWTGNVFVHPTQEQVVPIVERTISAVDTGEAEQAIVLVRAVMDEEHAGLLQPYVRGFLRKRPTFMTLAGEGVRSPAAYMLVYVCRNDDRLEDFAEVFGHLCDVYYAYKF